MLPLPVEEAIRRLCDDREHGADQLAREAIRVLELLAAAGSSELFREQLEVTCERIRTAQPAMAGVVHIAARASVTRNAQELAEFSRRLRSEASDAQEQAAAHAASLIRNGNVVLTHSRSGTVERAVAGARERGTSFKLLATESEPGGEGRLLAEAHGGQLIPDSTVWREMPSIDLVLVGADTVAPAGVVNKVGTALIALAAREMRKRMYAVCASSKLAPSAGDFGPLFDLTPLDWLTGVVTEEGVISGAALRGRFTVPDRSPRFILDVHLGRLARYLRLLGFDAVYSDHADDAELAATSSREHRYLLTRDIGLLERNAAALGYFVLATDPEVQAAEVVRRFRLVEDARPFTRCLACNAPLRPATLAEVRDSIPERIAATRTEFTLCPNCRKVYWKGTHYDRMLDWWNRLKETVPADF